MVDVAQAQKNLANAWANLRGAGGSIINQAGVNVTASANDADLFARQTMYLCGSDPDDMQWIADMINEAAKDSGQLAEMNALPTTDPKCHSKAMVYLHTGGLCKYEMVARNAGEQDCSG